MPKPPRRSVPAWRIQRLFNTNQYWMRMRAGEFSAYVQREHHPSPPLAFVPDCTRSQLVAYVDAVGTTIALVHQYLKPDGTLGASGRPDPKMLLHNGVLYTLKRR